MKVWIVFDKRSGAYRAVDECLVFDDKDSAFWQSVHLSSSTSGCWIVLEKEVNITAS